MKLFCPIFRAQTWNVLQPFKVEYYRTWSFTSCALMTLQKSKLTFYIFTLNCIFARLSLVLEKSRFLVEKVEEQAHQWYLVLLSRRTRTNLIYTLKLCCLNNSCSPCRIQRSSCTFPWLQYSFSHSFHFSVVYKLPGVGAQT